MTPKKFCFLVCHNWVIRAISPQTVSSLRDMFYFCTKFSFCNLVMTWFEVCNFVLILSGCQKSASATGRNPFPLPTVVRIAGLLNRLAFRLLATADSNRHTTPQEVRCRCRIFGHWIGYAFRMKYFKRPPPKGPTHEYSSAGLFLATRCCNAMPLLRRYFSNDGR